MPSDARAVLETFSVRELKAFAADAKVDVAGCKSKGDFVKRLAASSTVDVQLRTPSYQVRPFLAAKNVPQLLNLAAELGVPVTGGEKKADLVGKIAASPSAAQLLGPRPPPLPPPTAAPAPPRAAPGGADLAHREADPLIQQGRNQDVDFGLVEDVLDQARMRFEERNFDRALELSREALVLARGTLDAFERSAWAYALLASQRLIEESGRGGRDVEPAARILRDAKGAYRSGDLHAAANLLEQLQGATKSLYSEEVQRIRQVMFAVQDRIGQGKHLGADVSAAEDALGRARDAMQHAEHAASLEFVHEADRLAGTALEQRVREIDAMIPATERAIQEAQHVGADVTEAMRLLEKARVAIERKEYVLAGELVQRAERSSLQSQHMQIQKAMELRMRQIDKAARLVNYLVPIVDEAASYDLPIEEPKRVLADARDALEQGDYVSGTVLAKQAQDRLFAMLPQILEGRARTGISKPPAGRCPTCGSAEVAFLDDGWSRCSTCNAEWRWRTPSGLWERFRSLLKE